VALAGAFECDVNDLPLSMVISWYEQKAVAILLTLLFVLLRVMPGDPVAAALGARVSAEQLEVRREAAGLNDPILVQYGRYLGGVATGDLGNPVTDPRSVTQIVSCEISPVG